MRENINTRSYWENRFSSGDWEAKQGRWQTENFARGLIPHLQIRDNFEGTLLDFGCGLGDAMPIYRKHFPKARLVGFDISQSAIDICHKRYGSIALFMQGDPDSVPNVDIIIASNVFEHLTDNREVAKCLFPKCKSLYIMVPYKEQLSFPEHINTYDENYFLEIGKYDYKVFPCVGWSQYGIKGLWYQVYFKNLFRFLLRKPLCHRNMQIVFHFGGFHQ